MSVENVTAELLTLRVIGKDQENASFAMPLYIQKRSLHQDRLGTNTGETQKKRCVFCRSSPRRRLPSQSQGLQRCGRGGVV
jgi:hypothetical protein